MVKLAWAKPYFKDREDAARQLGGRLSEYKGQNPLVLAVPRGAVPMGKIVAEALDGELGLALVHKIGEPGNPEFALGAVSEGGEVYLAHYARALGHTEEYLAPEISRQIEILKQRRKRYAAAGPLPNADKRIVILLDDGIATGSTILAAIREVRHQGPLKVVVATAAAPPDVVENLRREADEVAALAVEADFGAVGEFFENFSQVTDEEVVRILKEGRSRPRIA